MPSFFFHLAFELYKQPEKDTPHLQAATPGVFVPSKGTDIFRTALPSHHYPSYPDDTINKRAHRRNRTITIGHTDQDIYGPLGADKRASKRRASKGGFDDNPSERFDVPFTRDLFEKSELKSIPHNTSAARDWRFERVAIESINMAPVLTTSDDKPTGSSISSSYGAGLATKGKFVPSDPKYTELGWGIVHLYRDAEETPGLYDDTGDSSSGASDMGAPAVKLPTATNKEWKEEDCSTLCILAVPSYLTSSDFLGFVGEKTREDVSHFRMIRTGRINRYMVLMKFRSAKRAREWRKEWNGKAFNSTEPENCHVVFVKSVQFQTPNSDQDQSSFPDITHDPFVARPEDTTAMKGSGGVASLSVAPTSFSTKPLAPPTPSLVELPTCPVCLERMDETTGLLTILCQHVFHCACLQKWRGSGCPVCRFTQADGVGKYSGPDMDKLSDSICSICAADQNLWMCLICGNVGCGRYDEAHAFSHYQETKHCYAMDIATQRVWDYAGDGYVHRLIQSGTDSKLVELPSGLHVRPHDDVVPREKLDNIGMEYTHLLTSQLDSQRMYFEEKVAQAADKSSKASESADRASQAATQAMQALEALQLSHNVLVHETLPSLERDKERAERRADKFSEMARKMEREWREEKAMNSNLMEKVTKLEEETVALKAERDDLAEQNRDLSFFITGGERLREAGVGEDIVEGTVSVPDLPADSKGKKKGKGKTK